MGSRLQGTTQQNTKYSPIFKPERLDLDPQARCQGYHATAIQHSTQGFLDWRSSGTNGVLIFFILFYFKTNFFSKNVSLNVF